MDRDRGPHLRIIDDELWQAVRARHEVIAEKYANVAEAVRKHHKKNLLSGVRRPKSLLSGLIFCGCCGGPYSLRGADRFACSSHISNDSCANSRTIPRNELEQRVLAGLKDRMMAPQVAAEAMQAYADELNRQNRERRSNGEAWKAELAKVERQIHDIIEAIKEGMYQPSMKGAMDDLEARKAELTELLADVPADVPDLLPSASAVYAKKVARLADALNQPQERTEAAEALRELIAKVVLTPGPNKGEIDAKLYGDLSTILNWVDRQPLGKTSKKNTPGARFTGVSVSVVAGTRNAPTDFSRSLFP